MTKPNTIHMMSDPIARSMARTLDQQTDFTDQNNTKNPLELIIPLSFTKPSIKKAYNSHGHWRLFSEIVEYERELENQPFTQFSQDAIQQYAKQAAIWLCPEPMQAFRYNCSHEDWELSKEELIQKYPDWLESVNEIDCRDVWFVDHTNDGDNGLLAIKIK